MKIAVKVVGFALLTQVMLLIMYCLGAMLVDALTVSIVGIIGTTCITGTYFGALLNVK